MRCTKCRYKFNGIGPYKCDKCGHTWERKSMRIVDVRDRAEMYKSKLVRAVMLALCDAMDGHSGKELFDLDEELFRQEP